MKLFLILSLSLLYITIAFPCRALALGSGGDRSAWEAGILESLSLFENNTNIHYSVVSGISSGALNAGIIASFPIGDEKRAIERIKTLTLTIKQDNIYKNWFGGILQGFFFKTGLYDTSPLWTTIQRVIDPIAIRNNKRVFLTGAHSVKTNSFKTFNNTSPHLMNAIYASGSIPGFFPTVKIADEHFIDGGVSYLTPISSAIRACKILGATSVHVDSVLAVADTDLPDLIRGRTTAYVLAKTIFHVMTGWFGKDIENARHSFPDAKIREFKPLKNLPGNYIGYDKQKELFDLGVADGKRIINV